MLQKLIRSENKMKCFFIVVCQTRLSINIEINSLLLLSSLVFPVITFCEGVHITGKITWLPNNWQNFTKHLYIGYWYFLLFKYGPIGYIGYIFISVIFDVTAIEIVYPYRSQIRAKLKATRQDFSPGKDKISCVRKYIDTVGSVEILAAIKYVTNVAMFTFWLSNLFVLTTTIIDFQGQQQFLFYTEDLYGQYDVRDKKNQFSTLKYALNDVGEKFISWENPVGFIVALERTTWTSFCIPESTWWQSLILCLQLGDATTICNSMIFATNNVYNTSTSLVVICEEVRSRSDNRAMHSFFDVANVKQKLPNDKVVYRLRGRNKDISRQVTLLNSCLFEALDGTTNMVLTGGVDNYVSGEFVFLLQISSHLADTPGNFNTFLKLIGDLGDCSFETQFRCICLLWLGNEMLFRPAGGCGRIFICLFYFLELFYWLKNPDIQ